MLPIPGSDDFRLLYGGSVNARNIDEIKKVKEIGGFLVGSASVDYAQIEGIIGSLKV